MGFWNWSLYCSPLNMRLHHCSHIPSYKIKKNPKKTHLFWWLVPTLHEKSHAALQLSSRGATAARHREKYYTKQFSKVGNVCLWCIPVQKEIKPIIITWLCDILALVWHFGPACVRFRPGLCDILALSCVTKASACHHTPISNTGAVYRKFHRSSVSKTT